MKAPYFDMALLALRAASPRFLMRSSRHDFRSKPNSGVAQFWYQPSLLSHKLELTMSISSQDSGGMACQALSIQSSVTTLHLMVGIM